MHTADLTPAAQYLRMSTEHQQYSITNQKEVLAKYAAQYGFEIVRTYSDPGRTGVTLKDRPGLKTLLQEVVADSRRYSAILVYDVSRWGRFQNTDESAHYEYICSKAGVRIHYCAEGFANDGSTQSSVMKALKRSMAAEYSRELSTKVYAGQKRLATLGYWVGALPGYGLKRMLVGPDGVVKQELKRGERKCIDTDRIILVPGPPEEIRLIKKIFRLCSEGELPEAIVRHLNRTGQFRRGVGWSYHHVMRILTNPKYAGIYVWARRSCKLGAPLTRNYPEEWAVNETAIKPIVSKAVFDKAQLSLHSRSTRTPSSKLLAEVLVLLKKRGRLTQEIISQASDVRSRSMCRERFGSLLTMYGLLGYKYPELDERRVKQRAVTLQLREELFQKIEKLFAGLVFRFKTNHKHRWLLRFSNGLPISVLFGENQELLSDRTSWLITPLEDESKYITLLCLRNRAGDAFEDLYVVPRIDLAKPFRITKDSKWLWDGVHLVALEDLFETVKRIAETAPMPDEPVGDLLGTA